MISRTKSEALFAEALQYIPGGVNSPVRAFRAVGGKPFFVNKASGCRVWDVDGNEYIDYVGTWGPAILGHAHPKIIAAIKESKIKVQAQIQDEQVRVTGKNRDDLQEAIQLLKGKDLGVEMQFLNFRE